jgi:hypothetical protein
MENSKRNRVVLLISITIFMLIQAYLAFAAPFEYHDLSDIFAQIGKILYEIAHKKYAVYAINLICTEILLYQIFRVGLSRVPGFKGEGGEGTSAAGKTAAIAISLMTTIALFTRFKDNMIFSWLNNLQNGYGVIAILIIAALIFFTQKSGKTDGNWRKPFMWAAVVVAIGFWIYKSKFLLAVFIVMLLIIAFSYKTGSGGGYDNPYKSRNHSEKRLRNWFKKGWRALRKAGGWIYRSMADLSYINMNLNKEKSHLSRADNQQKYINSLQNYTSRTANNLKDYIGRYGKNADPKIIGQYLRYLLESKKKEQESLKDILNNIDEMIKEVKEEKKKEKADEKEEGKDVRIIKGLMKGAEGYNNLMKRFKKVHRLFDYMQTDNTKESRELIRLTIRLQRMLKQVNAQTSMLADLAKNYTKYSIFQKRFLEISHIEGELKRSYDEIKKEEELVKEIINRRFQENSEMSQRLRRLFADVKQTAHEAKQKYEEVSSEEHMKEEREKELKKATNELKL